MRTKPQVKWRRFWAWFNFRPAGHIRGLRFFRADLMDGFVALGVWRAECLLGWRKA